MKLVVFGSTGGIGAQVVEQALTVGHEVTAVARRPAAITLRHDCLRVVAGDVLDAGSVRAAIRGQEVVVSAVGARDHGPTTVYSAGVANLMQAMQAEGARRIICVSASGLDPGPLWQRLIAKPLLWLILKNMYTDLVLMENEVSASGLDWTICARRSLPTERTPAIIRWRSTITCRDSPNFAGGRGRLHGDASEG